MNETPQEYVAAALISSRKLWMGLPGSMKAVGGSMVGGISQDAAGAAGAAGVSLGVARKALKRLESEGWVSEQNGFYNLTGTALGALQAPG